MTTTDPIRQTKADALAAFLLKHSGWVSSEELCLVFQVEPRELRSTNDLPGLCTEFAISSAKGFRHIDACTDQEWSSFEKRIRAHGKSELRRVEILSEKRIQTKPQLEMF